MDVAQEGKEREGVLFLLLYFVAVGFLEFRARSVMMLMMDAIKERYGWSCSNRCRLLPPLSVVTGREKKNNKKARENNTHITGLSKGQKKEVQVQGTGTKVPSLSLHHPSRVHNAISPKAYLLLQNNTGHLYGRLPV